MVDKAKAKVSETSPGILMLGHLCIKGTENLADQIDILDRFGLTDVDIATICNRAVQSARNARQQLRKKPKSK